MHPRYKKLAEEYSGGVKRTHREKEPEGLGASEGREARKKTA